MVVCSFFFFFSSRRRHTRFDCDWSSDVCSSDLHPPHQPRLLVRGESELVAGEGGPGIPPQVRDDAQVIETSRLGGVVPKRARQLRSEEHTSELQSQSNLVCRLLLEKKKKKKIH